jgi:hypothetical protein
LQFSISTSCCGQIQASAILASKLTSIWGTSGQQLAEGGASMRWACKRAFALLITTGSLAALGLHGAQAALIQVGSAAALDANLTIDWSVFGPPGTSLSCFCSAPVGPLTVGINGSSGTLNRAQEGLDYTGNFAPGAQLLLQPFISDEMTVGFFNTLILPQPVAAVGTQMQPLGVDLSHGFVGPFTGTMHVLTDDGNNANFSVMGNSTLAENNSAPFIGVVSTTDDIINVQFFADIGNPSFPEVGNIAINQMEVRVVPEPSSALLAASAIVAMLSLGVFRRRVITRSEAMKPSP